MLTGKLVGALAALGGYPYAVRSAVTPMDTPTQAPVWLDPEQFGVLAVSAGVVVFLLAVIAVGVFRR